jgi:Caspase domain
VGANPTKEADVDFQMLSTNLVLRQMGGSGTKLNIIILDACRNNPFGQAGLRAANGGLAEMRAPEGTLISFATQPGNVALDGTSGNSPFSKALAVTIKRPGLDIFRVFNEVGLAVASATGGAQQPWISASPIKGSFHFAGSPVGTEALVPEDSAAQVWAVTQSSTSQAILGDFIRQFGDTPYGAMARARLDELRKDQIAAASAAVSSQIAPSSTLAQPQIQSLKSLVDPVLVATFERDFVADSYDWRFIYSISADGNYHLTETQTEDGTFQAANGRYRTVNSKTGRVRTGHYRAAGASAIEVASAAGSAIFRPLQGTTTINPTHPVMLGVWRATTVQNGVTWMLTIENNPDGTYHYEGQSEDIGSFVGTDRQWRATSALSRKSGEGTYRAVDPHTIEIVDANGPVIWRRR